MQTPQRKLKDIKRLLSAFPALNGDPALILHNYLSVAEDWDADLVEAAVTMYIKGEVPGFDGRFAPTAPMLAGACRIAAERMARAKYLEGLNAARLPAPEITHTDEERARAKALVNAYVKAHDEREASLEMDAKAKDKMARHDSFFADEFVPTAGGVGRISKTLERLLGYSSGSSESDEAAA